MSSLCYLVATAAGASFGNSAVMVFVAVAVMLVVHALATARRDGESTIGWTWFDHLLYTVFLTTIGVLAGTSLISIWTLGYMTGWPLLIHLTFAGAFVFLLAFIALWWAPQNSLLRSSQHRFPMLSRLVFWALLVSGVLTAGSMFVSMLPVLDTAGLDWMIRAHRYIGLAMIAFAIIHSYGIFLNRFRQG